MNKPPVKPGLSSPQPQAPRMAPRAVLGPNGPVLAPSNHAVLKPMQRPIAPQALPSGVPASEPKPTAPSKTHQAQPAVAIKPETEGTNGFTRSESQLLHEALGLSHMRWYDGEQSILGKSDRIEVTLRPGQSGDHRWAVMAVPVYDMNAPGAVEICLHFLSEAYSMAHVLDFQYQIGINMDNERLEFLVILPTNSLTAAQLAEVIGGFTTAFLDSLEQEMAGLLEQFADETPVDKG